jgi:hypothetical protein
MRSVEETNQTLTEAASQLAGEAVVSLASAGAGANSRVLRVTTPTRTLGLKCYPHRPGDSRDRLDVEWRALRFLQGIGLEAVPEALGRDDVNRLMLMEWIEGELVSTQSPADLDAAAGFITSIFRASNEARAASFTLASEACLSASEINRQIEARLAAFAQHPMLETFLDTIFLPTLVAARAQIAQAPGSGRDLPVSLRRLIPADFGFHNALRQPDGRLRFIDFDYFGWDDPVKMTADFMLHPAMSLSPADKRALAAQFAAALPEDTAFLARLAAHKPLYALRWALILLNPFRTDRMDDAARRTPEHDLRLRRQIEKAEGMCARSLKDDMG